MISDLAQAQCEFFKLAFFLCNDRGFQLALKFAKSDSGPSYSWESPRNKRHKHVSYATAVKLGQSSLSGANTTPLGKSHHGSSNWRPHNDYRNSLGSQRGNNSVFTRLHFPRKSVFERLQPVFPSSFNSRLSQPASLKSGPKGLAFSQPNTAIRSLIYCGRCLSPNHLSTACRNRIKCWRCNQDEHISRQCFTFDSSQEAPAKSNSPFNRKQPAVIPTTRQPPLNGLRWIPKVHQPYNRPTNLCSPPLQTKLKTGCATSTVPAPSATSPSPPLPLPPQTTAITGDNDPTMAFLNVDPAPMMLAGFARVLVQGRPKLSRVVIPRVVPSNEDLAIVTVNNFPPGEIPFADVRNSILGLLEGQYELCVMDVQRSSFHRAQAYVRMNRVTDRDALIHHSPHQFQGLNMEVVAHNRGPNARRVLFNWECWLMLIGFPMDSRNVDDIRDAIKAFGRVTELEDVPHYIILSEGDDFEGVSLTVQCEIIQQNPVGDWASFFIMMLLSPAHFDWAKGFLNSEAWRFMISCTSIVSTMSFVIPESCPVDKEPQCLSHRDSNRISPSSSEDLPVQKKKKSSTPHVETKARRSPRIRSRNDGFKHSSCAAKNCLACVAIPLTLPNTTLKRIEADYCKLYRDQLPLYQDQKYFVSRIIGLSRNNLS
uniref:CCHC-type domain-containing protein n=1 Tax=Setaria viridis TaxID=4556 RepID=A0A4U6W6N9_SETVI|nr:hypothetical protein SEVIR_1G036261v2 [Setaria viridis]